jgi:hypothetical protein
MPTALSDPSSSFYILLGAIVVVLGAIALRRQKRSDLVSFGIAAAILLAVFLIDRAVESPREGVDRALTQIGTAGQANDYDGMFKHVSESLNYKGKSKHAARDAAEMAKRYFNDGIRIWGADRKGFKLIDETTAEQEFDAQFVNAPQTRHSCVGIFKKEDGEWRLTSFRLYPVVGGDGEKKQEVTPPGL